MSHDVKNTAALAIGSFAFETRSLRRFTTSFSSQHPEPQSSSNVLSWPSLLRIQSETLDFFTSLDLPSLAALTSNLGCYGTWSRRKWSQSNSGDELQGVVHHFSRNHQLRSGACIWDCKEIGEKMNVTFWTKTIVYLSSPEVVKSDTCQLGAAPVSDPLKCQLQIAFQRLV